MRKRVQRLRTLTAWLACLAWLLPTAWVYPQDPQNGATARPAISDIRLDEGDCLQGQLVNLDGQVVEGETLELYRGSHFIQRATSGKNGRFRFEDTMAGVYQIRFGSCAVACRAWSHGSAPPVAKSHLIVLSAPPTVRGQQPIECLFRNPLFIGLVAAVAVAIPVIIHNANDGS
jgi:hypothetical protein